RSLHDALPIALAREPRRRLGRAEQRPIAHGSTNLRAGDGLHVREVAERFVDLFDEAEGVTLVVLVTGANDPHHVIPRRGRTHAFPTLTEIVLDLVKRPVCEPAAGVEAVPERRFYLFPVQLARLQPLPLEVGILDLLVPEPAPAPLALVVARHRGGPPEGGGCVRAIGLQGARRWRTGGGRRLRRRRGAAPLARRGGRPAAEAAGGDGRAARGGWRRLRRRGVAGSLRSPAGWGHPLR